MHDEKIPTQEELAVTIGKNIMRLRKMANMTQLDLAEKLNYSDKSVSKWEQGNGMPDVRILMQLAALFHVSIDDLVRVHKEKQLSTGRALFIRHMIITLCSVGLCWLVATAAFVLLGLFLPAELEGKRFLWLAFLYAVPASSVITLVFSCIWQNKLFRVISISVLIWTALACVFLTAYVFGYNIWLIFLIGIPLQFLTLFFFLWWKGGRNQKE